MARINDQIQPSWDGIGKGNKNGLIRRWRSASAKILNKIVITENAKNEKNPQEYYLSYMDIQNYNN